MISLGKDLVDVTPIFPAYDANLGEIRFPLSTAASAAKLGIFECGFTVLFMVKLVFASSFITLFQHLLFTGPVGYRDPSMTNS